MNMKTYVVCSALLGSLTVQSATRYWIADQGGDLMDPASWDTESAVPVAGDKLIIDRGSTPVPGTFTFSTAETPLFEVVSFGHANGYARSLDPGEGKTLQTMRFVAAYDLLSLLSGTYIVTTHVWVGNSTSSSDKTRLTVTGGKTFVKTALLNLGRGSVDVAQSKAHLTVAGKAVFDADDVQLGPSGGAGNTLLVADPETCFYATNEVLKIGSSRIERASNKGWFYSTDNAVAVSNGASLVATRVDVGYTGNFDVTTVGNTFTVTEHATAAVGNLYVVGTNSVSVTDNGRLTAGSAHVGEGFWSGKGDSQIGGGSRMTVAGGGRAEIATVYVGSSNGERDSCGNELLVADGGLLDVENLKVCPGAQAEDCVLNVSGSTARVTVGTLLEVGASGRIVFDLADARASAAALVQLVKAPLFKDGAEIYITSSNPGIGKAEPFDCTLMSCEEAMDLSTVSVVIDPASGIRRVRCADASVLRVRGGRRSGLSAVIL